VNDNLDRVCASRCGRLFIVVDVGTWFCNALMILVLRAIEVLVTGRRGRCVGLLMLSFRLVGVVLLMSGG
jgi:hypothetical protein